jgi:DNA-binding transcriptional LysR family regulator
LAHADYVGYGDNSSAYLAVLEQIGIKLGTENFPYKTESHLAHWSLVKEGAAIGVMPDFVGDKEPLVQRVSDKLPPLPMDTWIVAHRELRTSRRIRTVFDFLVNELNALIEKRGRRD